ncbi:TetR/AcrR family transcriptional regulator [Actinomyces slackii]|uniref:Putative DNA-binding transcriptional regulator n=1 Tax=Actinomyces slackii TaxID=52774 RepID=A0A3S4SN32_9ACTO|nr:TetR family transcriptional regulator [Actinomyces slackii]VEG73799.1 putative DNA-binding transcriptional regulator [Actinomyces slackii]
MRTVPPLGLTAASRILNAAMLRFAKEGFGAGLRAIAADAGVTAGLITHHFGSKEGLRQACDAEVLRLTVEVKTNSSALGGPVDLLSQMARTEQYVPATAYAMRALSDGGPLAKQLLDSFVADAVEYMAQAVDDGYISATTDEEARSRYLMYSGFGALLLFARYEASDPTDIEAVTHEFMERYGPVTAELYTQPLFTDTQAFAAYLQAASNSAPRKEDS